MNPSLEYTRPVIIFDLDDTLYPERDFATSGYRAIARHLLTEIENPPDREKVARLPGIMTGALDAKRNPMDAMNNYLGHLSPRLEVALEIYRFHTPDLSISPEWENTLNALSSAGYKMGIITDGRSKSQRAKIEALGITKFFHPVDILISEEQGVDKTAPAMFRHFVSRYPNASAFVYTGDNPAKDFRRPALMGWYTIGLRGSSHNIHSQQGGFSPARWIDSPSEIIAIAAALCDPNTI